jgi:hypothetical protein
MSMRRAASHLFVVLFLCSGVLAQSSGYYKAIQKGLPNPIHPKQFKQIEQDALKNFTQPETYEQLTTAFGPTTEKVWGAIYGETYCNLSPDSDTSKRIGSLVFELYAKALTNNGGSISISLTKNAEASRNQPPFESQFEMGFLMGSISFGADASPMTIKKLMDIRKNQLSLWKQKNLPQSEFMKRLQAIISADQFEAYNYWLFQGARPDEFADWLKGHQTQYESWLKWQADNKFAVSRPDFQRLYMLQR